MTDKQDLYKEAMKFAKEKASISYVQRKCRCSYNDAERMLEQMVSEGVIGTYNGRKGGEAIGAGGVQALSAAPAEYVGNGMFKGETIQQAAEHWANWCDVRCLTGLSEFLRVVAAPPTPTPTPTAAQPAITSESGAVYAELPAPTASIGIDDAWHEPAMRDFADRTHALRMQQAAPKAAPEAFLSRVTALCTNRGSSPENIEAWDKYDKWIADLWRQAEAMLAASPTPPAEQQAAPKAAPGAPAAIKMVGYGGCTGINDYLMSDGTIKTMRQHEVVWRETPLQAVAGEPVANDIHGALTAAAIYLTNAQRQYGKEMHRQAIASLEKAKRAVAQAADFAKAAPQQEAQEPVAWLYTTPMQDGSDFVGASSERLQIGVGTPPDTIEQPLYLEAPQPAPHLPERDASLPAERQGLFRKFVVGRVDGSDKPGGKHHGCTYFVLDVDHDPCARPALAAYAAACESTHPTLAADLRTKWGVVPAPQPAPAPLSDDAKDVARLDWLLLSISGAEFRRIGVHYSGNARRTDVDAAIAAQEGKA